MLILDEPTAGQDNKHYVEFMEFVGEIAEKGVGILFITHDMHLALEYAHRAVVLSGGRVIADSEVSSILEVSYRVAYGINIALRYIPDVSEEFKNIMLTQKARGVAFRKDEAGIVERIVNYNTIPIPLVLSSLNRVEVVTNAMNLRGFGRKRKRTWYSGSSYTNLDFISIGVYYIKNNILNGFWDPFN